MGFKLIWRPEPVCQGCHQLYQPFVSAWDDLFVEPPIRRADNFPGELPAELLHQMLHECCSMIVLWAFLSARQARSSLPACMSQEYS